MEQSNTHHSKGAIANKNTFPPSPLVAERPQHMLMRVAVGIHGENIEKAIEVRR